MSIFETMQCELEESSMSGVVPEDGHVDMEDDGREVSKSDETTTV